MSAKGVSVVAFANAALRRGTFYPVVELLGETRNHCRLAGQELFLGTEMLYSLGNRNLHHPDYAGLTQRRRDGDRMGDHGEHRRGWLSKNGKRCA
jgi:hypothetical protein